MLDGCGNYCETDCVAAASFLFVCCDGSAFLFQAFRIGIGIDIGIIGISGSKINRNR